MKWDISNDKEQIKVIYSNKDEPWNIMLSWKKPNTKKNREN